MRSLVVPASVSLLVLACGSTPPASVAAPTTPPPPEAEPQTEPRPTEARTEERLPAACEQAGGAVCTPPAAFSKRLCSMPYPDVALAMFAKGTPWTRAYVTHETEAWNASGGHTTSARLELAEEVLILIQREAKGTIQVGSGGGNYDILRWDGTCASLMADEVTMKRPSKPKYAPIPWRNLDNRLRDALLADPAIEKVDAERKKECSGAIGTEMPPKCAKADARLSLLIVERVRSGEPLPLPDRLP